MTEKKARCEMREATEAPCPMGVVGKPFDPATAEALVEEWSGTGMPIRLICQECSDREDDFVVEDAVMDVSDVNQQADWAFLLRCGHVYLGYAEERD